MKINRLFLGMIAVAAIVAGCKENEEDLGTPSISVSQTELSFSETGGASNAQTVYVTSTRDWTASCSADWVVISPTSGTASSDAVEVSIYVDANTATDRSATVTFATTTVQATVKISQAGPNGETNGEGTAASPYTVADALEIINNGTYTSNNVYVKGIVSSIDEIDTSYGNATYNISDDGTTSADQLEVYRGYYLGNTHFTSEDQLKVGDEVIVCGVITMYYSTPEITQYNYLYSINGETGAELEPGESTGSGTADDPYSVDKALDIISEGSYTSDNVYVQGVVCTVSEIDTSYGNATYNISHDGKTTSTQLEVYRGYYLGNTSFTSEDQLKVGDEVIVCGQLINYNGTYEITQYNYLYSINGNVYEAPDLGDVDLTDPYTANVIWTIVTGDDYYGEAADQVIINDVTYDNVLKLGSSSKVGSGYCSIPAGTKSFVFYCLGWNGDSDSPYTVTIGTASYSYTANTNSGVNNNSPFTIDESTLVSGDYHVINLDSALTEDTQLTVTTTRASKGRIIVFGAKYFDTDQEGGDDNGNNGDDNTDGEETGGSLAYGTDSGVEVDTDYSTIVTWASGSKAYDYTTTVNGSSESYEIMKLGSGSAVGSDTCTIPAGSTSFGYYVVAWSGKSDVPYQITIGSDVYTDVCQGNSGFSGSGTSYNLTGISASDYRLITFASALTEDTTVTVETTSTDIDPRAGFFGVKYFPNDGADDNSGNGSNVTTTGDGTVDNPYTIADCFAILTAGTESTSEVYLTGTVSKVGSLNSSYGELTYYLSDDGTTTSDNLEIYLGYGLNGEKITSADYLTVGDKIVLSGVIKNYNGTFETNYGSKIYSINGDTGSTGEQDEKFVANVTWSGDTSTHCEPSDVAVIDGVSYSNVLKIGTSSAVGSGTCTLPAGATSFSFYCLGWSSTPCKVTIGESSYDYTADGSPKVSGNSPYTISSSELDENDYCQITFDALTEDTTLTFETTGSGYRVVVFGAKYAPEN